MASKYKIIQYGPEVVEDIRKEFNLDTEEKREKAYKIIEEWLLKQDHLIQKTYSKEYLEKCLITGKGSIERTKLQIDKMCTFRTLLPQYFQVSNLKESVLMEFLDKCNVGYASKLTPDYYRVVILKIKPDIKVKSSDFVNLHKFFSLVKEFLKTNDYNKGYIFIGDTLDANTAEIFSKLDFVELQQFLPVLTEGLGAKIKGIIFLTGSKFIEGFVKMIKPLFKEKIRSRIHVATNKDCLKELVPEDILPIEYGGTEKPLEDLCQDLKETLQRQEVQELLREMNAAKTDETKRRVDKFNDQYMGMPGSFRTMSLD